MNLLLDTHAWIWALQEPGRLGPKTKRLLLGAGHRNHVCPISTLEISRLVAIDAIRLSVSLDEWVRRSIGELRADTVELSHEIALEAYRLPKSFHKDPVDRILVAACRCRRLTMVTADRRILRYEGVRTQDARQ